MKERRQCEKGATDQDLREVPGIVEGGESSEKEAEQEEKCSWHLNSN